MREFIASAPDRLAIYRRLAAAGPVLLLHVAFLIAFLQMNINPFNRDNVSEHEIILLLTPTPAVPDWQGDLMPALGSATIMLPRPMLTSLARTSRYEATAANSGDVFSGLQGVSQALFKCWPGTLTGLRQVQEAQCLTFVPDQSSEFFRPREQSQNAAEWLRDRDRRNAPLRLPCVYGIVPQMIPATVICVANGLLNGFDLPSYAEDDNDGHASGADTIRHEMQTVDPCELDRTYGLGFVCLYRVVNGNTPP